MTIQRKKRWLPLGNIPLKLELNGLYDSNQFEIILSDFDFPNKTFKVVFKSGTYLVYRNIDESNYQNEQFEVDDGQLDFGLFIIQNSLLKQWFHEQEIFNKFSTDETIHYAIHTMNDWVDIIALKKFPPTLEWIPE